MIGRILSGIGGIYLVETEGGEVACRARGVLRKENVTPLAGDMAEISLERDTAGIVERILPRRNAFIRPPVANVDKLVVVTSTVSPSPNTTVIDKTLAIAEAKSVAPILVINKVDLADPSEWEAIYEKSGYPVFIVSATEKSGVEELRQAMTGYVCAFTGNSGVGKSSLLNALDVRLSLETGETSRKLGRGRHTTRASRLYPQEGGGYFVDTAGFSSLDTERVEKIPAEELPLCFREFQPYLGGCRFTSCRHMEERDCAIKAAVERGEIAVSRYESYRLMRETAEKTRRWER